MDRLAQPPTMRPAARLSRSRPGWPVLAAGRLARAALLTAVAIVAVVLTMPGRAAARVDEDPPDVIGQSYAAALDKLSAWQPDVQIEVPNGLPPGVDRAQVTVSTERLANPGWSDKGTKPQVDLYLLASAPDLNGMTLHEARAAMLARGIHLVVSPNNAPDSAIVTEQSPTAGTDMPVYDNRRRVAPPSNDTGTFDCTDRCPPTFVSIRAAADRARVPDLHGMREDQAQAAVQAAGLVFTLDLVQDGATPGTVVGQDPEPGTVVARRSAVRVQVERVPGPAGAEGTGPPGQPEPTVVTVVLRRAAPAGGLLLLALLALLLAGLLRRSGRRRRERRSRAKPAEVRVEAHYPPPHLHIDTVAGSASHVVTVRMHPAAGAAQLEEIRK
jgi:PASTA domain